MKKLFCFLLVIMFSYSSHIFADKDNLIVGTTSGYAPFVSLNKNGEYEGFDIDFANILAKRLNKKLVLRDLGSMNSLMLALNQNKIDAIIWAISITEDRMKNLNMIHYQGKDLTQYPIAFWKKIPEQFSNNIGDICQKAKDYISVEAGSFQEDILKCYPKVNIRYIEKITDAVMDVKYGKSIAFILDDSLIPTLRKQNPDLIIKYLDLPSSQRVFGYGVAIKKTNDKLTSRVKKAIDELKKDKTIANLEVKWNIVGT